MRLDAFYLGLIAGYLAAIPVGAAGIALLETAICKGMTRAMIGGMGIAMVDATFAAIACFIGEPAAALLAPHKAIIGVVGGAIIILVGLRGLYRGDEDDPLDTTCETAQREAAWRSFKKLALLTAVNPLTTIFFVAFILAAPASTFEYPFSSIQFIAGVGLACLSWESVLAVLGGLAGENAGESLRHRLSVFGNVAVIVIGGLLAAYGLLLILGLDAYLPDWLMKPKMGLGHP